MWWVSPETLTSFPWGQLYTSICYCSCWTPWSWGSAKVFTREVLPICSPTMIPLLKVKGSLGKLVWSKIKRSVSWLIGIHVPQSPASSWLGTRGQPCLCSVLQIFRKFNNCLHFPGNKWRWLLNTENTWKCMLHPRSGLNVFIKNLHLICQEVSAFTGADIWDL